MILDHTGKPFPEVPIGEQYAEALCRSFRDTLRNRTEAAHAGWTADQFAHWVNTGEEP